MLPFSQVIYLYYSTLTVQYIEAAKFKYRVMPHLVWPYGRYLKADLILDWNDYLPIRHKVCKWRLRRAYGAATDLSSQPWPLSRGRAHPVLGSQGFEETNLETTAGDL